MSEIELAKTAIRKSRHTVYITIVVALTVIIVLGGAIFAFAYTAHQNNQKNYRIQVACLDHGGVYDSHDQCLMGSATR